MDWERFNEASLPDKEAFYSNLNMENITDVDHRHAKRVFKNLNNKNLGDYHDLYLQIDTLLLPDVFENFRNMCVKVYELDPAHLLSAPGLAWQACLKKTGVELELITNVDMLLMIEKGVRDGICHVIHKYVKANNKHIIYYDENKELSYIIYLHAGNFYEWAMPQKLPVNGHKWAKNVSKIDEDFIKSYDEDGDISYFLEVDIEYPRELHGLHSVHVRSLKQALKRGLKLKKVHKEIAFHQKAWFREYIDMNAELRKKAKNDWEKDFYKLMNNAAFGKTVQNERRFI